MSNWKKRLLASAVSIPMLAALAPVANAEPTQQQDAQLVASWDFTGAYKSENGTLKDSTGTYSMVLKNNAYVERFGDRNNNEALQLKGDSQQYAEIDSSVFAQIGNEATIEFAAKSRHADNGNYFSFTVGKDASKYLMFYLSTASAKLAIADNGWRNEPGFKQSVQDNDNRWHNYRILIKNDTLALQRDNELVGYKANTGINLSDLEGTTAYIGRSFYSGDASWNGAIDDLKIYKGANINLPTVVNISGDSVVNNSLSLIEGSSTRLVANVTPADALSTKVIWSSSNSSVASIDADGVVKAAKAGNITITAITQAGNVKAELPVTVKALDAQASVQADLDSALSAIKKSTTENLPLVTSGSHYGSNIVWTSSDAKRISATDTAYQAPKNGAADPYKGGGIVTRPNYGAGDAKAVTLTATATKDGKTATGSVDVVVKEKTRTAPDTGYAAVTFLSDAHTTGGKIGEALYESATSMEENNFFSFKQINGGNPVITSTTDSTGLRDPYVLKSHDGDKYYMIATDLKVSAQGWGQNQQYGSLKIEAWESRDMVNWIRTNAEDGTDAGIVVNSANQGMTWAPEAFWDDSLGAYVVFFSSRAYTDDSRSTAMKGAKGGAYNIVRYSITRDFKTFTPSVDWQDTKYSRIDSTVFKIGDYYYRLTKNEESGAAGNYIKTGKSTFLERSKCLTCTTTSADPKADENTAWRLLDENLLPFEGPESIALNEGDINQNEKKDAMVIMADSSGYQPFMTSASALSATNWSARLSATDGWKTQKDVAPGVTGYVFDKGMPVPKRHGAFVNVSAAVLKAMHAYSTQNKATLEAVDSTTALSFDEKNRTLTATVSAADKGSVAGSVEFAAGSWKSVVKLADGKATVTVPNDVDGTVGARYDGYTDGLVKASESSTQVKAVEKEEEPVAPKPEPKPEDKPEEKPVKIETSKTQANEKKPLARTGSAVLGVLVVAFGLALTGLVLYSSKKRL